MSNVNVWGVGDRFVKWFPVKKDAVAYAEKEGIPTITQRTYSCCPDRFNARQTICWMLNGEGFVEQDTLNSKGKKIS